MAEIQPTNWLHSEVIFLILHAFPQGKIDQNSPLQKRDAVLLKGFYEDSFYCD